MLIKEVTNDLENYHVFEASKRLIDFINELSTWYVRRSRDRFKNEGEDKEMAVATLGEVIEKLLKVMAPFTPFIAEKIYRSSEFRVQSSNNEESIHLQDWPEVDKEMIDEKVLKEMELVRKVVEMGLALRAENGIKIRQPLLELGIMNYELGSELRQVVSDELNVKNVGIGGKEIGDNYKIKEDGSLKVSLDITITPELKKEGLVREIVRTINQSRKEQKMTISDKVVVEYQTTDKILNEVFAEFAEEIKKSVLASEIKGGDSGVETEIDGVKVKLSVTKE
jgi:isoleucyl-tRNA synthetase